MKQRRDASASNKNSSNSNSKAKSPSSSSVVSPKSNHKRQGKAAATQGGGEGGDLLQLEARRSTRISATKYSRHDGDSWQETLAVCEMPTSHHNSKGSKDKDVANAMGKLKIRSYYCNQRTGERIWDEPPSGASEILPATQEMRNMAEAQLQEMQLITIGGEASPSPSAEHKKRGFFRRGKSSPPQETISPRAKLTYKPGSFLSQVKKNTTRQHHSSSSSSRRRDKGVDPELQKAIALSINDASSTIPPTGTRDSNVSAVDDNQDDEELAMVMALSLSEQEAYAAAPVLSEEEMFQRALVESRRARQSTSEAAAMPIKDEYSQLLASASSSSASSTSPTLSNNEKKRTRHSKNHARQGNYSQTPRKEKALPLDYDQKMPAKPTARQNENESPIISTASSRQRSPEQAATAAVPTRRGVRRSTDPNYASTRTQQPCSAFGRDESTSSSRKRSSSRQSSSVPRSSHDDRGVQKDNSNPLDLSLLQGLSSSSFDSKSSKYGRSVRPASSKHLNIVRSSSSSSGGGGGGSRRSASMRVFIDEDDRNTNKETKTESFASRRGETLVAPKTTMTMTTTSDYSQSRAASRSLFGSTK